MKENIKCLHCDNHHFVVNFPYLRRDKVLECPCCHTIHKLSKATKKLSIIGVKQRKPKTPYWEKGPGFCRWCGETIRNHAGTINNKKKWHEQCLHEYFLRSRPMYARRFIWERDQGKCAKCDTEVKRRYGDWDLDHIVPLIDGGSHGPENMQILCKPCHKVKTSQEAKERAKRKSK